MSELPNTALPPSHMCLYLILKHMSPKSCDTRAPFHQTLFWSVSVAIPASRRRYLSHFALQCLPYSIKGRADGTHGYKSIGCNRNFYSAVQSGTTGQRNSINLAGSSNRGITCDTVASNGCSRSFPGILYICPSITSCEVYFTCTNLFVFTFLFCCCSW